MSRFIYGWRGPSPEGKRFPTANTTGLTAKPEVDPRNDPAMPPIFDQGQLGSCTANAIAAALEYDANLDGQTPFRRSRLFLYYGEREREGTLGQGDTGAYGYDGFLVAGDTGVPPETDFPYDIAKFQDPPSAHALADAKLHKLTKPVHQVVQTETAIKQVLSNKQMISFGFTVHESFEDESWWESGVMPIPKPGEQELGGHEIDQVGYLKAYPHHILCRNSWNLVYGLGGKPGGYFLFPTAHLVKKTVASDFRTIVRPVAA